MSVQTMQPKSKRQITYSNQLIVVAIVKVQGRKNESKTIDRKLIHVKKKLKGPRGIITSAFLLLWGKFDRLFVRQLI